MLRLAKEMKEKNEKNGKSETNGKNEKNGNNGKNESKRKLSIKVNHKHPQPSKKIKSTPKPNHFVDDFVAPIYSPVHLPPSNTVEEFDEEIEQVINPPPFNTVEVNYEEAPPLNKLLDHVSNILTSSSKVTKRVLHGKFPKSCRPE